MEMLFVELIMRKSSGTVELSLLQYNRKLWSPPQ
uniref:Uncharacterized protein n=1 Tax=Anguilla anguilla TaxID=7936 RepID=A0A0E9PU53_ANGAN